MRTKKPKAIVLKFSNCYRRSFCFFCDQFDRPDILDAFVEGTWDRVCPQCLNAQSGIPGLSQAVATANGLVILLRDGKSLDAIQSLVRDFLYASPPPPPCQSQRPFVGTPSA